MKGDFNARVSNFIAWRRPNCYDTSPVQWVSDLKGWHFFIVCAGDFHLNLRCFVSKCFLISSLIDSCSNMDKAVLAKRQ